MDDFFSWFFGDMDDTPRAPFSQFRLAPPAQEPFFDDFLGREPGFRMGPRQGPPDTPPPRITPSLDAADIRAVDPGAIRRCLYRFTFVMLNNNQRFWMWPVFVGRRSVAGFRWTGRRWVYFGIDLRRIASFRCY